ncbi:UDP-glucose 4-epimerase GalE [Paenarthrobacter aurescens]|uniref:UDP-glucose 4-epimerase n=1 Tax=Paenarthrobacter aurescens TaxID=43663 RepID=A0A4Y3NF67_PAEAU|nr:UDP-glucose 4-epimerase GalE [Paenarthrobacter aurescens]MDO6144553.1 UDP-glucose 4-epimerase GalE [Paenarthrobacter aurescens]MDO6148398.1 UDP-glucose 4-epimerase GalE [Paenarthrobacter aurescens]MDO6159644.1 UDP-glucose 4-epimerase GalE [Paenarthrobacter aurescens]MDO6164546.1 UDP-glucose 4-epimerase GalE [Paenarthrobacter aurescens]GEB17786.1 UDP-glucose 4-epimerase [Paenarthrobacter aurescens]
MKVLVTGGAGYIGSHTVLCLLNDGHEVVVLDNLRNSSPESLLRVEELAAKRIDLRRIDILDAAALDQVLAQGEFEAVIHFAGLKAVGESVENPLSYYRNNVVGTLNLLESMERAGVKKLVFSSSATVYGDSEHVPHVEKAPLDATNPYGRTKEQIEDILTDLGAAKPEWAIALLRYFNPVGAHESGLIGEDPRGTPNNLLPFVSQVAIGRRKKVTVFGNDYPTHDGTGVRDYIHVMDLASGHLAALNFIAPANGVYRWNLGTGRGSSVLDVIEAFRLASGRSIPYEFAARRPGDVAISYADASAALADLGWSAGKNLSQMCEDHWRWQSLNPLGYS